MRRMYNEPLLIRTFNLKKRVKIFFFKTPCITLKTFLFALFSVALILTPLYTLLKFQTNLTFIIVFSAYDVPPAPNNFIAPGKRPMSSMSTTIVVDEQVGYLAKVQPA